MRRNWCNGFWALEHFAVCKLSAILLALNRLFATRPAQLSEDIGLHAVAVYGPRTWLKKITVSSRLFESTGLRANQKPSLRKPRPLTSLA